MVTIKEKQNRYYKITVFCYKIHDFFSAPKNKLLDFDKKKGNTVVDY
jgi:hypothetical protein